MDFAPRGASKFQQKIRDKLPNQLDSKVSQRSEALGRFYNACAVWLAFAIHLQLGYAN